MIFAAASMSLAFRSFIFFSAICRSWSWVIVADLLAVRLGRALLERQRLLDQHRRRRALGDERERAVLVDGDHDRDHRAGVGLRLGVERLDELHDVDAVLAERGADRRRRAGLAADRLELDLGENLLRHRRAARPRSS